MNFTIARYLGVNLQGICELVFSARVVLPPRQRRPRWVPLALLPGAIFMSTGITTGRASQRYPARSVEVAATATRDDGDGQVSEETADLPPASRPSRPSTGSSCSA